MEFLKKRKWQLLSSLVLTGIVVGLFVFIVTESSKQRPKSKRNVASVGRGPASIQKVFDFSALQGTALEYAAKQRLASSITVAKEDQGSVVQVGNFVVTGDDSQKDFACGYYDQVTLEFDADGMAVSGDIPHLTVQTGCDVGDNINQLEPIHIPVQKLKSQAPGNSEYKFYDSPKPMSVQMANSPNEWPSHWVMTSLKFSSSQSPSRLLRIEASEIRAGSGKIKMNW